MDSLPFSQSTLLGTQGEDPCFMVMNSQVEESQEGVQAVKMTNNDNSGVIGPNKQRMLWELAALRGTQPSPVLATDGQDVDQQFTLLKPHDQQHPQKEEFKARKRTGSQPTNPAQRSSSAGNRGDDNQGNTAGNDGTGGGNQGNQGQEAGGGAAGGGEGGGGGGEEGGGGDGEEDDEDEHEETGEETSQETSSSHSSVPKLVPPPALQTPPRTVRVKEVVGGAVTSPATSPDTAAGPEQSDEDQRGGSERGGGVSDAPTAVAGDSTDEGQGAVTTPSPPSDRGGGGEGWAGGSGLMDPPLHSMIPRKRSSASDTSHSSISSSSCHSTNSSSYHASHDTPSTSSSLLSSLSTSSSSSYGLPAASSRFTQTKDHPSKPPAPLPHTPSGTCESFHGELSGEGEMEHPQSSQQDLFADVTEEKKGIRVLANETSASEDASIAEVPPTPDAYKYGFQDTPPHRLDQTLRRQQDGSNLHQQGEQVLVHETSTSDDASVTIIWPSPQAWGTVIANTPPHMIEQYSRSSRSTHEDSNHTPSTPSETLGSLHLSGQQELSGSQDSGPSVVPPTLGAYGSIPQLIPSTPTLQDEEEPMELSMQEDEGDVAKRPQSTGAYDDEYGIPKWQQVLNKEQQAALSRSSSTSSKTTTSPSSEQSLQSFGRMSAQMRGQQIESFQAWQPSSQQTTSTTSEEPPRSRPPSTQAKLEAGEPQSSGRRQDIPDKSRSSSALAGSTGKVEIQQQQTFLSQPRRGIPEGSTSTSKLQQPPSDRPAAHQPALLDPKQDPATRLTQVKTTFETGTRQLEPTKASSSISSGEKQERVEGEAWRAGEDPRQGGRGGSSDDWMLHYTATQTDTEADAFEERAGRGRGSGSAVQHPPVPPTSHPALSSTSAPRHHEEASATSTTLGGAAASHTLMSYTDATSSSTTASSDAKKKEEEEKNLLGDKRDVRAEAFRASVRTPETQSKDARSRTGAQSRTDAPEHSVSLVVPGPESQSGDAAEFSSIDFHLSIPTEGGLRPAGGVTLPSLAHRPKERSSSRQPIRHSTPIMDESPDKDQGTTAPSTNAQIDAPKVVRSSTLTLGAAMESETQNGTETPVFQLERPSDAAQLLEAAHESPSKKSTSVFSKVHETKMAASQTKIKGQTTRSGAVKYSESDDPFALSQEHPHTSSRHALEPELTGQQQQAEVEDEDEETIPVYYQEEEPEAPRVTTERIEETGKQKTGDPEGKSEKGRGKASEKTPEKKQWEKSDSPALSSRLTRSGQKRKLQEERPEDRKGKRGGTAKKKRLEEAKHRDLREKPPGPRDPYDFSDSQSNKTPSPMKSDSLPVHSKSQSIRNPTASAPKLKTHTTKDASAEPSTTRSATTPGSKTRETPKRQRKDKNKEPPSPGQEKTPPVEDVLEASKQTSRMTPNQGGLPGSKSESFVKTSSTHGRRGETCRQRLASQQVLQVQQDDSSPDFQPDQPREKAGVKFRRSPRKKPSQKHDKPAATDPSLPRRHIVRQTTEYRLIHEKIIVNGKVVKTWETQEQVGPTIETIEDEDSLDLPSPSRSHSSLTSGSLADVSSMYSKTSSSTPSLIRTLSGSGGTLSKHSSFSSISRTGSSLSKQTVSSPGSDKSSPGLNKSLSSPRSDKSSGNGRKASGGLPSPGVAGPSIPRRVSFTRGTSKPPSLTRTSSGSGDETRLHAGQDPKGVFQKPHQTQRRKVEHQEGDGFAHRLSLQDAGEAKSPEEVGTQERHIPAAEVAELVQLSQECAPVKETGREDRSSARSNEMKFPKDKTSVSSSSPHPLSSPSARRSSRASSIQSEQDTSNRRSIPRTRSTPARSVSSVEEVQRMTRRSEGKSDSVTRTSEAGQVSPERSKKTSVEKPTPEHSPQEEPQLEPQTRRRGSKSLAGATGEREDVEADSKRPSDAERSMPRLSRGKARGAPKKRPSPPTSPGRPSTPPQQSTKPLTSDPSSSFPRDTLFEPPAGETLPIAEGEGAPLLPGLKVYTKWLDGFWYPGTIHHQDKLARYVIEFDDGDHRTVNERDVIIKEWLNRGQSVMAEDADGYYYAGIVVGYYKEPDSSTSGYVIEQTTSHQTSRYERRHVILTKDQAASLVSSASSSSSTSGSNLISLDNILYSKRTRLHSRLLESPGSSGVEKLPRQPQKTTPSRLGVKRKLAPTDEQQKTRTPSPRKRGRGTAQAAAVTPSPGPSTSPRRSPRKRQQQQQQQQESQAEAHPMVIHMGPLPKQPTLFRNHAFLVTHGEVRKTPSKQTTSSSESTDESSGEGLEEIETVPFDRSYAVQQIERGGGLALSDFNKSQITKMKVLLIANTYCRTKKYFQALAAGIPCISHLWLRDCCKSGRLQNHKSYLLPAGESLEENALTEIQPNRSILAGMNVCMVSDLEGVQDTWRSILIAAGCHIVTRLPSNLEIAKDPSLSLDCNVIVTDPSCPRSLYHRAQRLNIPVVSCEWVIQCLINGVRVPYHSHEKYAWNYRDKSTK